MQLSLFLSVPVILLSDSLEVSFPESVIPHDLVIKSLEDLLSLVSFELVLPGCETSTQEHLRQEWIHGILVATLVESS